MTVPTEVAVAGTDLEVERHYSVAEIAALWNVSGNVVRALFRDREGVLKIGKKGLLSRRKREYVTLRIPASVAAAVHRELGR